MNELKWCHFADAHLGYRQYNLDQRFMDFGDAFSNCVNLMLDEKPDFLTFSGDLFEHYNPNPPELRQAVKVLNKIKDHEIPIFLIGGNHDISYSKIKRYGGDVLDFLADLGLINYIQDEVKIVEKKGQDIAVIAGLHYLGKRTPQVLDDFISKNTKLLKETNLPKILLLHAFIEGQVPNPDITVYQLAQLHMDFIGMGHYHLHWEDEKNKIFYPGATEHRTAAEWKQKDRGFYTIDCKESDKSWSIRPIYKTYGVRPKKYIQKDFGLCSVDEVIKEATKLITENDEPKILLKLNLSGSLKKGEFSFLNLHKLKVLAKNALFIDIVSNFTDSSIGPVEKITSREAIVEVLEKEFNITKENIPKYVSLVEDILNLLENKNDQGILDRMEEILPLIDIKISSEKIGEKIKIDEKKEAEMVLKKVKNSEAKKPKSIPKKKKALDKWIK